MVRTTKTDETRASGRRLSRRRRGSVLVLVVATLGLLAVIGTVYIVTARTERGSATAAQVKANFDYAQDAIHKIVEQTVMRSMVDANGNLGGYYYNATNPRSFQVARRYTMPELGFQPGPGNAFVVEGTTYNMVIPSEAWLAGHTYRASEGIIPDTKYMNLSILGPYVMTGGSPRIVAYNPRNAGFDLAYTPGTFFPQFKAVADPLPTAMVFWTPLPLVGVATEPFDSLVQMLPFSDASGIRYRYGLRIIDTSRMANLNTGLALNGSTNPDTVGLAPNSYLLGLNNFLLDPGDSGRVTLLDDPAYGRKPVSFATFQDTRAVSATYQPFDLADELELRLKGDLGSNVPPRPGIIWPATLQNVEPALGTRYRRSSFTTWSYSREFRLFPSFEDAAARYALQTDTANTNPVTDDAQDILNNNHPGNVAAGDVYPLSPDRIDMRSTLTGVALAVNATNLATAMKYAGFNPTGPGENPGFPRSEVNAFIANYLTYRSSDWHQRRVGNTDVWSMITPISATMCYGGPSYIDDIGFVYKGGVMHDPSTGAATDPTKLHPMNFAGFITSKDTPPKALQVLTSEDPGRRYIGYAAQPFINEVAFNIVTEEDPNNAGVALPAKVNEMAIELANPYDFDLDLRDYILKIDGEEFDLANYATAAFIPKNGYYVISNRNAGDPSLASQFLAKLDAAAQHTEIQTLVNTSDAVRVIQLYRKYGDRTNQLKKAEIDHYTTASLPAATGTFPVVENKYFRRANDATGARPQIGRWAQTIHDPAVAEVMRSAAPADPPPAAGAEGMTLGAVNPPLPSLPARLFPLIDGRLRLGGVEGAGFVNPNEFNKVMRISHVIDPASGDAVPAVGAYPTQLTGKLSGGDAAVAHTEFPIDASLHFDFRTPPAVYQTPPPPLATAPVFLPNDRLPLTPPPASYKAGDFRANYLLENISFAGDGTIAGQININTAPFEVLCSIAPFDVANDVARSRWAAAILAYRYRSISNGTDPRVPQTSPAYDFRNQTEYPGYGIRSLGELHVALTTQNVAAAGTMEARDQLWGSIYPVCTVRSDTFIVYGYMDAVRQNPRYTGAFNNAEDWYGTNSNVGSIELTDDPNNTTAKLQRVGRRRWIALLDRTSVYAGNGQPRVIAVRNIAD